jgi:predicted 2-oxoglutarate/Fe(II)-dependent dioxygenase YbiX
MKPLMAKQFACSTNFFVHDAFCVRYAAEKSTNHLPVHTDESTHSFVIALNDCDEYEGGGTYFPQNDRIFRLKVGEVLSFRGDSLSHGGEAVTKNVRYILVAFLYHEDEDSQHATIDNGNKETKRSRSDKLDALHSTAKKVKSEFSFGFDL